MKISWSSFIYFLWRNDCSTFCPFLNWLVLVVVVQLWGTFIYSENQSILKYMTYKYVLSPIWIDFHSADSILRCTKVFDFHKVKFVGFSFVAYAFGVIAKSNVMKLPPLFSKSLIILVLTFRSLIHWSSLWHRVQLNLFALWISSFPNTISWKDCFFLHRMSLTHLSKSSDQIWDDFVWHSEFYSICLSAHL